MAVNEPATESWNDPEWDASASAAPALVAEVPPAARTFPELRAIARWTLVLGAGVAVWTGAIYGLLRLLTDPLS